MNQRRLLLTSQQRQIPLASILSQAYVTHDPTQHPLPTSTPAFFCRERINENGEIVPLSKPLPPCRTCVGSRSELEDSYNRFKREVKLPAVDYYSGGGGGMIGAKGFLQHKHAVEMDETACKTLK
jgi:hypothetical protein